MNLTLDTIAFPAGTILLASTDNAVCALDYFGYEERMRRLLSAAFDDVRLTPGQSRFRGAIEQYLAGKLDAIDTVPVDARGTRFQLRVWKALREIPHGETWTYQQLARRIDHPKAARAVGLANSQNPVAIIQPCHRVIGASGRLVGYAGGLEAKRWLLRHEGALKESTGSGQRQNRIRTGSLGSVQHTQDLLFGN